MKKLYSWFMLNDLSSKFVIIGIALLALWLVYKILEKELI